VLVERAAGNHGHVELVRGHPVAVVSIGVAVQDDDCNRSVTPAVEGLFMAWVCAEVRAQGGSKRCVEVDHVRAGAADPTPPVLEGTPRAVAGERAAPLGSGESRLMTNASEHYPYRWAWGYGQRDWDLPDERVNRKGRPCRVVCRGSMNSAPIEFEDGHRMVASRNGLRRRGAQVYDPDE
jgi:hypothetical protein